MNLQQNKTWVINAIVEDEEKNWYLEIIYLLEWYIFIIPLLKEGFCI